MFRVLVAVLFAANLWAQTTVVANWNDPNQGVISNCSISVTTNCLNGYNLYDTTTSRTILNSSIIPIPNGATSSTVISYTLGTYTTLLSRTIVATVVFMDTNGNPGESGDSNTATASFSSQGSILTGNTILSGSVVIE